MATDNQADARVSGSKFDLGATEPAAEIDAGDLPWSYGEDRITAIVRDPDSAYLYWELTDEGIASARSRLGAAAGPHGWCNVRVYDTTGRDFDGTNANDYFDIRVDRTDREYYVMIRRPGSSVHVEIGVKTHEGYFQPICRSGRADFPRNGPSANTVLEWMTVTGEDAPPCAAPCRSRYAGPEPPLPSRAGAGYVDVWRAAYAPSMPEKDPAPQHGRDTGSGSHHAVARAHAEHIERWWRLDEWRAEWRGGLRFTRWLGATHEHSAFSWREGPFPLELFDAQGVGVELLGEVPVHMRAEGTEFVIYGPWRVVIRGYQAEPNRRVLATWSMRWVRAVTPMIERWGQVLERRLVSAYERSHLVAGASERHALRELGASEQWRLGASERMWLGGSEWMAAGASETLWLGASQFALGGASAALYRGASERLGASERTSMGASDWGRAGASGGQGASPPMGAAGESTAGRASERWAERPPEKGGQ
jgi:hypothetical protein